MSLSLASHFLESLSRKMPELRIWKLSQFGICALVCTCLCMCKEGWDNGNRKSSKMVGLRTNYRKIKCLIFFRGVEKSEDQVGMRIIVPVDTSGCSFWHLVHCRLYYTSRPRLINDLRCHVTNVETAGLSAVRLHTVFVFVTAFVLLVLCFSLSAHHLQQAQAWLIALIVVSVFGIFIGPESDHCIPFSLTH